MTMMFYREHSSKASQRQVISSGDVYCPGANIYGSLLGLQIYRSNNDPSFNKNKQTNKNSKCGAKL